MTMRQTRDLALKLTGIYYISSAVIYTPNVIGMSFSLFKNPEPVGLGIGWKLALIFPAAVWISAGLSLLFWTDKIHAILWSVKDESEEGAFEKPSLRFWIVLVSFFFLIRSVGGTGAMAWMFISDNPIRGNYWYLKYLPHVFTLVASLFCITKSHVVDKWLGKCIGEGSGGVADADQD